jgi:hypothetical protein
MQKLIVMSATYRQSSKTTPELYEKDPENRLLARGPRHRLPAEMIRDNALFTSGLLVNDIGGPSVKPYQPEGLWEEKTSGRGLVKYIPDMGDKLYRRSLYTFWKRTVPPPAMTIFDASTRDLCTVQRQKTSTPMQALVLLNDPQIIEASRVVAYKMIENSGDDPADRLKYGFRIITGRIPDEDEIEQLLEALADEYDKFKLTPARADTLMNIGQAEQRPDLDIIESAAYTVIASTIFNLYETITKG